MTQQLTHCAHRGNPVKVIDRLGMMREQQDGTVSAPLLEWHFECPDCGAVLASHFRPDPEEVQAAVQHALAKVAGAIVTTYRYVNNRPLP